LDALLRRPDPELRVSALSILGSGRQGIGGQWIGYYPSEEGQRVNVFSRKINTKQDKIS